MMAPDFVRLLKNANPDSEVWWDSSPTQYAAFRRQMSARYPLAQDTIERLLPERFALSRSGISGATTNPRLVTSAILEKSSKWLPSIRVLRQRRSADQVRQKIYAQLITQGAGLLKDLWHASCQRQGWLSAQVDARDVHDANGMVQQGLALAHSAANVMVKVPGSEAGYQAIERLAALGCSTNNTFCFSVSQVAAGVAAIRRGQATALSNHRDISGAHHVITFMIGRWGAEAVLDQQARARGLRLSPTDKRWGEIAIYQAIQAFMARAGSPARLLMSSIKVDSMADGSRHCWHLEKTGEYTTCYTLTPAIIEFMVQRAASGDPLRADLTSGVPFDVLRKLMQLPYFRDACFEEAIKTQDFGRQPAFIRARHEACLARRRLTDFIQAADLSTAALTARGQTSSGYWGASI
jgi:transaldolase